MCSYLFTVNLEDKLFLCVFFLFGNAPMIQREEISPQISILPEDSLFWK